MSKIPTKVETRIVNGIKKFQGVLNAAKTKDINESDTVVIVTDMLAEVLGFEKYSEITSEYSIKKTFCDLAIKIEGKIKFLIEVKAAGLNLKDEHIRQAVDYGSNEGLEWVILTNGCYWKVYKILFKRPIEHEHVYDIDFLNLNYKDEDDLEKIFYISKESISKSALEDFHTQKQTVNKFAIGQLIITEPIVDTIRKSLRKISPDIKIYNEDIENILIHEVIKREVFEGDKSEEARKKINKWIKSLVKKEDENNSTTDEINNIESKTENNIQTEQ